MDTSFDATGQPLAAARTRPVSAAEPAKVIGWLLLAAFGIWNLVLYAGGPNPVNLVFAAVPLTLLVGFVQAHRHPGRLFARLWIGFFTGFIVVASVFVKVVDIVS